MFLISSKQNSMQNCSRNKVNINENILEIVLFTKEEVLGNTKIIIRFVSIKKNICLAKF